MTFRKDASAVEGNPASQDLSEADKMAAAAAAARPVVCVVGLGGAGSNIVSWIKEKGMAGGKLVAANTDAVHLSVTRADRRILIGEKLTHGQGAGGHPDVGEKAAYESLQELREAVAGSRILLLCAGLGGGTGTGAINVLEGAPRRRHPKDRRRHASLLFREVQVQESQEGPREASGVLRHRGRDRQYQALQGRG